MDCALGVPGDPARSEHATLPPFSTNEPVQFRVRVYGATRELRARVEWLDSTGHVTHAEAQSVIQGEDKLKFLAPGSLSWTPGDYEVRLKVVGEFACERHFRVIDPPSERILR